MRMEKPTSDPTAASGISAAVALIATPAAISIAPSSASLPTANPGLRRRGRGESA